MIVFQGAPQSILSSQRSPGAKRPPATPCITLETIMCNVLGLAKAKKAFILSTPLCGASDNLLGFPFIIPSCLLPLKASPQQRLQDIMILAKSIEGIKLSL